MGMQNEWLVSERAERMILLLLTSRKDLVIANELHGPDMGIDIVVAIKDEKETVPTRVFLVQAKATTSSDKSEWLKAVNHLFKPDHIYLPTCLFMANVKENNLEFSWLAEPSTQGNSAKLEMITKPNFSKLDNSKIDDIVARVRKWYDVVSKLT